MTSSDAALRLDALLARWGHFEECLLHDLRLIGYGYSAELAFNLVRDEEGRVRDDVLERPRLVTIRLQGLTALRLTGGLPPGLEAAAVDWGLSEVALVRRYEVPGVPGVPGLSGAPDGVGLRVLWEGDRRIEAECRDVTVTE